MPEGRPSLRRLLPEAAERLADEPALSEAGVPVTYGQLAAEAAGCAERLAAMGVGPGDRVALLAPNSLAFVAGFFGVVSVGGVAVCVSPDATTHELTGMLETTAPLAAVAVREAATVAALPAAVGDRTVWAEDLCAPAWATGATLEVPGREDADPAFLAFTSGSTGRPKGALHRADTLVRAGADYLEHVLDGRPRRLQANLPMYHMGGMVLVLLPALLGGGCVSLSRGFRVDEVVETLVRDRIDAMLLIPAMAELLFLRCRPEELDLSALEVVAMGGAPVSTEIVEQVARRLGVRVQVGYGSTEVPGLFTITPRDTPPGDIGPFVGLPTDAYEVAVLDDAGHSLPAGETGELCIRTPYRLVEYLGNPEATAATIDEHGWVHSGDLASLRQDGGVVIRGRKKEMYIRGGFNVYPAEVEAVLASHPDVSAAAVHAVADPVLGEKGWAWVCPTPGSRPDVDQLHDFVASKLSRSKVPDVIHVVDELPMNAIGKVDKPALRARAERAVSQNP